MARPFRFLYPYASYHMVSDMAETHTRNELYREYTRMRTEANKRIERLGKSAYRNTQIYLKNRGGFRGGSRMNKAQLSRAMSDVARFLASKSSTVEGAREIKRKAIETFREEWGFDFINWRNYDEFVNFLDKAADGRPTRYNLDDVAMLFQSAKKSRIDLSEVLKNYDHYLAQVSESEEIVKLKRPAGTASSSASLRNRQKGKKGKKGRR